MSERYALSVALALNLSLAVIEIVAGLWSRSIALLVDAADFLEDSAIYGLALWLGGRTKVDEVRFGLFIAGLMSVPGAVALWQLVQRLADSSIPDGQSIWVVSSLALVANLVSAMVIGLARRAAATEGLGLRAAWLSSRNDAIANIAMIGAGFAVSSLKAAWPDTVVGIGIAVLHFSGAYAVARLAISKRAKG